MTEVTDARGAPPVDVEAIRKQLRRLDVLSGMAQMSESASREMDTVCQGIAFNYAADLLAELDRLRQAKEDVEQTIADQDGELKFERQRAAEKEQLAVEWHVKATQHAVDTARVERQRDALQRRLAALTESGREVAKLTNEYWLHDRECAECHRVRRLGQACWQQVERFDKLWTANEAFRKALDADAQEPARED